MDSSVATTSTAAPRRLQVDFDGRLSSPFPRVIPRDQLRRLKSAAWGPASGNLRDESNSIAFDLAILLLVRFLGQDFSIEEAADFTLYETVYRDDAHLKAPTLADLERRGALEVVQTNRKINRPGSYPPATVLRFVPPVTEPERRLR
jgi:hypothetical protein